MSKNYKEMNDKDLEKELLDTKEDLRAFRFGIAGSRKRDVKSGKNLRKEIAQILTEKNARKSAETK